MSHWQRDIVSVSGLLEAASDLCSNRIVLLVPAMLGIQGSIQSLQVSGDIPSEGI
jgi:hypothetical protein